MSAPPPFDGQWSGEMDCLITYVVEINGMSAAGIANMGFARLRNITPQQIANRARALGLGDITDGRQITPDPSSPPCGAGPSPNVGYTYGSSRVPVGAGPSSSGVMVTAGPSTNPYTYGSGYRAGPSQPGRYAGEGSSTYHNGTGNAGPSSSTFPYYPGRFASSPSDSGSSPPLSPGPWVPYTNGTTSPQGWSSNINWTPQMDAQLIAGWQANRNAEQLAHEAWAVAAGITSYQQIASRGIHLGYILQTGHEPGRC
ncbi:hypothetical protein LTR16_000760 [Cryomyces antarcticus]|uniref:Uncharacterized protein n=1 Tax=Cryomyces antarcticus TaxID=329879 RepID=A0ABR0LQW2_9PEZI|nr:hypothetical protein LTR60_000330 [Cryomyces antarcticus]KAK5201995.1 hypothetical protein LTR16_000760 [Cryomyces antarcticus]